MKGILLTPELNRAIRNGEKTVYRGIVPEETANGWYRLLLTRRGNPHYQELPGPSMMERYLLNQAPLQPGSTVFVKEAFQRDQDRIRYEGDSPGGASWWRPASAMTVRDARTFLRILQVQTERLQDIREQDVPLEVPLRVLTSSWGYATRRLSNRDRYARWWDRNVQWSDRDRYAWRCNPMVYRYTFAVADPKQVFCHRGEEETEL